MPKLKSKEYIVQSQLLSWYRINKRILPWRKLGSNDLPKPYFVLISEFMLQQTTVNTVLKKFKEFVILYPNFKKLSIINEDQILQIWSGLGYYARAKNLLKSAKIIKSKYKSVIPQNYNQLITLPGIGDYTAKAIMGIGYNKSVMPIDANIERILSRLYGLKKNISSIKKKIFFLAEQYVSKNQSSNLIQAFMDYGSSICKPRNPKCNICVIAKYCITNKMNLIDTIPKNNKIQIAKRKKYTRAYVIVNNFDEVLVRKRLPNGMLPSMLEVPNDKWVENKKLLKKDKIYKFFQKKLSKCKTITYSFSHFDLEVEIFFMKEFKKKIINHKWILLNNVGKSSMPTIMKKIVAIAKN